MSGSSTNHQQATYWQHVGGPHWVRQQQQYDRMLASFGATTLDVADPRTDESLLDIGCGTGTTTIALAHRVGPSGHAHGVDIAPVMIEAARAHGAGIDQLSFAVADAQREPLGVDEAALFDAAFSRFGVMFFDDPTAAFANIAAAVRDGGRLTFVCWQHESTNDWISLPAQIMRGFTPNPLFPPENAPGPFAFHDPDRVRGVLATAGWRDIAIDPFTAPVLLGGGDGAEAAMTQTMGTFVAQQLREQVDAATFDQAAQQVRDLFDAHLVNDAVIFDGNVWIVSAQR